MYQLSNDDVVSVVGSGPVGDLAACGRISSPRDVVNIGNCAYGIYTALTAANALADATRTSTTRADMDARCASNSDCAATMGPSGGTSSGSGNPNSVGYYDDDMQDF